MSALSPKTQCSTILISNTTKAVHTFASWPAPHLLDKVELGPLAVADLNKKERVLNSG